MGRFWLFRLCLIQLFTIFLISLLVYRHQITKDSSVLVKVAYTNANKIKYENEKSLFKIRLNQRLFYIGQRFSHISVSKLLQIQSNATQFFTYYCSSFCGGWGDRLRGITSAYILAVLLRRRFIIDMKHPCDLTNFVLPNLIDWTPIQNINKLNTTLRLNLIPHPGNKKVRSLMLSSNLIKDWSKHDNILFTTNDDYVSVVLKNPIFNLSISELNIRSNESTQQDLFPFLYELLFKPTSIIIDTVNQLFLKSSLHFNQSIICMHVRAGKNPTMSNDKKIPFRQSMAYDMMKFIDRNLSSPRSSIFAASDSYQNQEYIQSHYGKDRMLTISGPIIHIDRLNRSLLSTDTIYRGFLKVIAEFYFLGECDTLLRCRSGFSEWAGRRRLNEYSNLYIYCRGIHRVSSSRWRRPHSIC